MVFALPGVQIMDAFDALYHDPPFAWSWYATSCRRPTWPTVTPAPPASRECIGGPRTGRPEHHRRHRHRLRTSSPVLLVSGQIDSTGLGQNRGALHEIAEQLDVFEHLTKWGQPHHRSSRNPGHGPYRHGAFGQRPAPPRGDRGPWDVLPRKRRGRAFRTGGLPQGPAQRRSLREAAELLARAERPLIWAGGGGREAELSAELLELARALNAPVMTTAQGKGAIQKTTR